MAKVESRREAILRIINEIEGVLPLNVNSYFEDSGFSELTDNRLFGNVLALRRYADTEGWSQIVDALDSLALEPHTAIVLLEDLRGFALPEARRMVEHLADDDAKLRVAAIWESIHPRIKSIARSRFETGHFADAIEAAFKELNSVVKEHVRGLTGLEYDGANLMRTAFSPNKPIVRIADLDTASGRDLQQGFMEIGAGAMTAVRNPHAHANLEIDRPRAIHLLYLASLLMSVFDERRPSGLPPRSSDSPNN